MTSEAGDGGTHLTAHTTGWKRRRTMISFDITGPGAIDGELGNIFHGVHFGDEDESEIESFQKPLKMLKKRKRMLWKKQLKKLRNLKKNQPITPLKKAENKVS